MFSFGPPSWCTATGRTNEGPAGITSRLLLLLPLIPEMLLLGRADCAQRVQVSVLVLVQGGCSGRRQRGGLIHGLQ